MASLTVRTGTVPGRERPCKHRREFTWARGRSRGRGPVVGGVSLNQDQRDGFGVLLRTLRRAGGLTQEDLAERSGSSVRSIREMERGRVQYPQRRTAALLADALGLDGSARSRFLDLARTVRFPRTVAEPSNGAGTAMAVESPGGAGTEAGSESLTPSTDSPAPGAVAGPAPGPAGGAAAGPAAGAVVSVVSGEPPATVGPSELPAAVPDLAGRAGELDALRTLTADIVAGRTDTASLVVLHGPPGIGKTSLTVAAGHRLSASFTDGQLFVDLSGAATDLGDPETAASTGDRDGTAGHGRVDPADALAALLRSLGLPDSRVPVSLAERSGLFRTLTRDRRLLVVLDNATDEAQVRPLLPAGRHCLVLVTSRRPLTGLAGAVRVALGVLDPAEGRQLLTSIVGTDRVTAEPAAAEQLVRLCGRLPLAIRIAGNRLATRPQWTVSHLVAQLRDQRRRLTVLTAGDLGVRAAFEVSYRQLDSATAAAFRRASLIPGADFDAGLVTAAAGNDEESATQAAEDLVDAGLLLSLGDRYRFHDLVRLYAYERLGGDETPEQRTVAHDRMVSWLLRRTEQAGAMFDPGAGVSANPPVSTARAGSPFDDHRAAGAWLDRESGNWPAALRDAARQGWHADVVRVARALHWYSDAATHRHSWDEIFSLGVTAARALRSARDEAVLLNFLGWARYYCRERNSDGLAALEQALELARRIGDRREEAWALTYSASIFVRSGRAGYAVDSSRQAVALFRQVGYELGEACAANVQGTALGALGRHAEAAELHRDVLEFYRRRSGLSSTNALIAQAATMMCLGADLAGEQMWREAAGEYAQARALFQQCAATFAEASAAYRHGVALRALGDVEAATEQLRQALALFVAVPSPWWEARTLHVLAALAGADPVGAADARLLRRRALDRCGELDAPEAHSLRATLLRELAD
ncbi:helix-turn-helix domain-containing protein [Plantactinospora solaniradicis]|uniref:Helix-turn-helix domain-containing protein n=1 Tax=Plantactinospora solaniradicis TaxID=1723736 RepID=A0ABW1K6E5_9ACTN